MLLLLGFYLKLNITNLHNFVNFFLFILLIRFQELLEGLCDAAQQILSSNNVYFDQLKETQQLMLARSILTSLGLLKFRHKELLNSICALMSEKLDKNEGAGSECASMLMPKDQTAFLMTTATLNYIPVNSEKLYQVNSDMHTTSHLCT